jgi:DsbC/DsbD-like thiol-disulfide interchange protein
MTFSKRTAAAAAAAITTIFLITVLAGPAHAQLRSMKADVTPAVPGGQVFRAGGKGTVTLRVKLPETVHVQSDRPLDKSLIPTALTIEPPAGLRVEKIVYPAAAKLKQEGQAQPLAVFGHDFTITVHLTVAAGTAAGELSVPGRLRYQACDEFMCYPPKNVDTQWAIRIAG